MNRQDACSTRKFPLCGTGILPVLDNGARCEVERASSPFLINSGRPAHPTKQVYWLWNGLLARSQSTAGGLEAQPLLPTSKLTFVERASSPFSIHSGRARSPTPTPHKQIDFCGTGF
ncbi:hypothetical protein QUA08_07920 [Microcoleus sp. T3B2]